MGQTGKEIFYVRHLKIDFVLGYVVYLWEKSCFYVESCKFRSFDRPFVSSVPSDGSV